jgi:hypothetical protein
MQLTFNTNLCGGKPLIVKEFYISLRRFFFYNCQKNVTFMHRYQVAKYVIFDSEKIFVKKFPWMLK